jgi:hypothetical protein
MTSTAEIERALITALGTIRQNWAALLEPLLNASASVGTEPVTGGGSELTALEARVSLRYETILCLNSWSKLVADERALTHALPLQHDAIGLADLLTLHAVWMSGHETGPQCADEIQHIASRVKDSAEGNRVAKIQVGRCPETIWETDDQLSRCPGNLWASVRHEDSMLPKDVRCDGPTQHTWAPHEWASLGRRVYASDASETVA